MKPNKLPVGSFVRIEKGELQTILDSLRQQRVPDNRADGPRRCYCARRLGFTGSIADRLPGCAGWRQLPARNRVKHPDTSTTSWGPNR